MSKLIVLAIGGDSITGCTSAGICYPYQYLNVTGVGDCGSASNQAAAQYSATVSGIPLIAKNLGISGSVLKGIAPSMTAQAQTYGDVMITSSGGSVGGGGATPIPTRRFVYSLLAGSNDGCVHGDVPTFVADVVAFCAARKAAGWNAVIIGTVLPRNDGGPLTESNRLAYNSTIMGAGWAAANGIDGIFDLASDSIMGDIANCSNATYYNSDKIHPTTVGHARLAPIWGTTLSTIV